MNLFRRFPLLPVVCAVFCLGIKTGRCEEAPVRELRIEPATTGVPFGKAKLNVEPLRRVKGGGESFQATYKVEVSPLSFASEEGGLTITISNETLHKLASGQPIEFSGRAVSTSRNDSDVSGTATPSRDSKDTGAIRVRIDSKKGKLVFKTTYHLVK